MPQISQNYFRAAVIFLLAGIAMGLQMSISGDHNVTGAHTHLSLLGWVSCAIFGTYFALFPEKSASLTATLQFWIVVLSCAVMTGSLYLLLVGYTNLVGVVAIGSLAYAVGAVLFAWIVFASAAHSEPVRGHAHR